VDQVFWWAAGGSGGKGILTAQKSTFLKKLWNLDKSADNSDPDNPIDKIKKFPDISLQLQRTQNKRSK
jgi:hypothetical protein